MLRSFSLFVALLLASVSFLLAQAGLTGGMVGVVSDPTGGIIAGAKVVVTNTGTNESTESTTDANGNFRTLNLRPGKYKVEVEAAGFKRAVREEITIQIDQQARIDFSLALGSTSEVLVVEASAPVLQTETGSLGQVVDNTKIVSLPLNGRGAFSLIGLVPGVVEGPNASTSGASARIGGGRNRLNEIQLDGVSNVNIKGGGVGYTPMVDALQEFKVLTNSFSAEYGRTGGGVVLATVKSGANEFHGVLFEFLRNDALNARNFFARPNERKPTLRQNQYGVAVGGPILKDRTFFFADWQGTKIRTAAIRNSNVPTEQLRSGDFRGFPTIFDPATTRIVNGQVIRDPFPGNIVPRDRFDPSAVKYLELYPLPNAGGLVNNYVIQPSGKNDSNQGDLRIDHNVSQNIRLFGRFSINDNTNTPAPRFFTIGNSEFYPSVGRQYNAAFSYLHTFSPTFINEVRAGFNRNLSDTVSETYNQNYPSQFGILNVPPDVLPLIDITGFTSVGNARGAPSIGSSTSYQLIENATWLKGRQTIKFGFDFRRSHSSTFNPTNASGQFGFGPLQTSSANVPNSGHAFASFLLGAGSGLQLLPGLSSYLTFPSYDFYVQDDIRVNSRLTINLGLRYEPAFHFTERFNRISQFNPATRVLDFAGENGNPRYFYKNDLMNFGPRFGIAYSPFSRTVIRAGYGMYFASAPVASNPGTPLEAAFPWARSIALPPTTYPQEVLYTLSRFPGAQGPDFDRTGRTAGEVVFFDPESKAPYMQSWNFSIQRELVANLALDVAYAGTIGTHIYTPGSNLNQIAPELLGPPAQFGGLSAQQRRPFPDHQNIAYNTFGVSSNYHSLQVKLDQRFAAGLTYLVSYTWSKAIDNGSGLFPGDNPNVSNSFRVQNRYCMSCERSIAADDQTHRFVASYTYDLPWGPGRRYWNSNSVLAKILGSWQLGGIALIRSGYPFGISSTQNTSNALGGNQRANRIKDGNLPSGERTIERWFDTTAFVNPEPFTFGNAARNVLRAPMRTNFDLMLAKSFPFTESLRLDFRAEAFNLTNTPPFGFPGATVGTPNFGVITSAGDARIFQLALKLNF